MGIEKLGQVALLGKKYKKYFKIIEDDVQKKINDWIEKGYEVEYLGQSSAQGPYDYMRTTYSFWIYKEI